MEYNGIIGSKGIAISKAYCHKNEKLSINEAELNENDLKQELDKIDESISLSIEQIDRIAAQAAKDFGPEEASIFEAHRMILEDPELAGSIKEKIETEKIYSSNAAQRVIDNYVQIFSDFEDEYFRERAADIRDVGSRLIRNLLGVAEQDLGNLDSDVIVVAHDLTPSDTALMDKKHVKAFATDIGGRTSHTAIMARSLEIPAVLGLNDITEKVQNGDMLIVDGNEGRVIVNPDENTLRDYRNRIMIEEEQRKKLLEAAILPSITLDGKLVEIGANIGGPAEIDSVIQYGGDCVGLYRTEFLYMDREALPDEEEQFIAYQTVARKMKEKPVIIRTLDIGGDKKLTYLPLQKEMNPFLGFRAIRLCLEMKELFKTQLKAILRASTEKNVLIMYPMISSVDEVLAANHILEEAKSELREQGTAFDEEIKCGVMIEIPSAAVTADLIIKEVDFFSIGTNDLCQYTLAVDRMNEKISYLYQPFHPGVLRLIKNVIEEAHKAGKFAGMCGELAGEPEAALLLLGLGLDEFSMSASSILTVRSIIRSVTYEKAKQIADHAMTLGTSAEIQEYCRSELEKLNTETKEA